MAGPFEGAGTGACGGGREDAAMVVAAFLWLLAPGLLAGRRSPIVAAVLSLGLAVYLATLCSYLDLRLFSAVWVAVTGLAVVRRGKADEPVPPALWPVLAAVALTRFAQASLHELPPGWDPTFHCLIAHKIGLAHHVVSDWSPFEQVRLNYPVASHVLVAWLADLTGAPVHTAFNYLIPCLGVLSTALIYAYARSVRASERAAVCAALAYGLWAVCGSLDYYRWGGVPNELGMLFFVGALALLREPGWLWPGLLLTDVALTHHHVMLTCAALLATLSLFDRRLLLRLLKLAGVCLVLGGFYLVPYALKAPTVGHTNVWTFAEEFYDLPRILFGYGLGPWFALISAWGVVRELRVRALDPQVLRLLTTLALLFVGLEYGYRFWARSHWGLDVVAFTPSRFLADAAYFLSVLAGCAWDALLPRTAVALGLGGLLALTNWGAWTNPEVTQPALPPDVWQALRWIEANTPPDTFVLNDISWAPYGSWRRTLLTPIPISEPLLEGTPLQALRARMAAGQLPTPAEASRLVKIQYGGADPGGRVLWSHPSGLVVFEVLR